MISNLLKTWLAPYEVYLWAGAAVLLLMLGLAAVHHEREIGANKVKAADAKVMALENQLKAKVEADAQKSLDPANSQLHAALDAPPPDATFSLRVCKPAGASGAKQVVPANGGSGPGRGSDPQPVRDPVAGVPASDGVDIRPTTEQLLAKADAEIAYWHKYYADCKAHGICK
jgi:hypothetical protein